jgi:hypothetical protein
MKVKGPGKSLTIRIALVKFLFEYQVKSNAICCTEAVQCHIELNGTVLRTTADVITREEFGGPIDRSTSEPPSEVGQLGVAPRVIDPFYYVPARGLKGPRCGMSIP